MRDTRYQAYVDIRYFVTTPGDNIDLVAPMFCDALLTLKKTEGKKIQDINGILDFAVRHSNKAYPKIDLGVKHFVPTCDGGLMHNSSFIGFIHYAILLKARTQAFSGAFACRGCSPRRFSEARSRCPAFCCRRFS